MAKIKNFSLVFKVVLGACLLTAGFFCVQQSVLAADLSVSCQAVPSTAKVGDTVTFQTFVSGGTGNYSNYTWYATLNGRTGPEPMLYLDSAGVKTAYLQVSDGVQTAQSARCSVTATANTPTPPVVSDLSVSCQAVPSTAKVGDTVSFRALSSGGTGNYSNYTWFGALNGRTGPEPMLYLSSVGTKYASVQVSDGTQTVQSTRCSVTVADNTPIITPTPTPTPVSNLSVSCQAVPSTAKVGDTVSFRALPSEGTGNYSNYTWFGALSNSTGPEPMLYLDSVGTKTAYVQVSDGTQTVQSARCSVTATANTPTPVPVEDKSRGTLSASSLSVFMGEYVSVSINGLDANGIDRICLQKQTSGYDYDCKSCSRATSCSGTWYVTSPYFGTFDWYGSVIGLTTMGNDDTAATNPVKVSIEFKNKCVSDSGCDYNGKRECLVGQNNGYRICETDPNGCRKWRSDSCNNQICQASDGQCVNPVVANCNSNNCVSEYSSDYKCNDLKTRLDRVWLSRQCVNDVCQTNPISLYSNFSITCSGADKVEYRCSWNNLEKRITKTNSICLTDQNKCGDQVGNWELVKTCGSGTCDFVKQDCISAPITPPVTPQCIANDHKSCDNGDVYWFDSCNVRGALVKDCGSNVVEDYICSLDNKLQKRTLSDTCSGKVCDQLISGYLTVLDCNVGNLNCDVTQKKCVNFCTAHNYQKCDNNSIYYYNACGVREEAVKNCSDLDSVTSELRCNPSGTNWVQVKKIKGVCSGNDTVCSTNTEWSDYKQCDSQQTCNSGQCVGKIDVCKAKSYTACYSGSLFWFSSCDRAEVFYQDCQDEATNEYRCSADYKVLERKYLTKTCGVGKKACETSGEYWKIVENCESKQQVCNPAINSCNSPNLTVWCFTAPNPVKANKPTWFIAQASGGIGPYRFSWSGDASGSNQSSKVTFTNLGSYTGRLVVTANTQSKEATCSVNVTSAGCFCAQWPKDWQNIGCGQGSCGSNQMQQKRTRNCYPTACNQEAETRCQADTSCQTGDHSTSGNLTAVQTGRDCDQYGRNCTTKIRVTINGTDSDGLAEFRAYYQYDWHSQFVSGTSQNKTWELTETRPGKFNYPFCGSIVGLRPDGVKASGVYTSPSCVFLQIDNN